MSAQEQTAPQQGGVTELDAGFSLLDQAIGATKQTDRSVAEDLLRTLTDEALKGTVTFKVSELTT